jgi:Flp pilus assembly protein TadD
MLRLVWACRLGYLAASVALALVGAPAMAQRTPARLPTVSRPVVQPIPGRDGMTLNAALSRLARDPRDVDALVDAGNAALVMGDVDAATGFFRRADQVAPGNPRVKAGLAGAMVRNGDPFDAIPLFDQAEKAGALDSALAADRGLAYDLVGDNTTAQRYYRESLARTPSDEVVRRLALSLAISGDKHNAEQVLSPLLAQRDAAAWRTRAFALAILGQTEEAVSIANTVLPSEIATGIAPYLRYMPRLTRAQQAAAANFGMFPRASEIGRDDPRVAQYAPRRGTVAAETALMPQGEPLGRKSRSRDRKRSPARAETAAAAPAATAIPTTARPTRGTRVGPPEPLPTRQAANVRVASPAAQAALASTPVRAAAPPAPPPTAPTSAGPSATVAVTPGFSLVPSTPATPASPPPATPIAPPPAPPVSAPPAPVVQAPPPSEPPVPRSLRDAFAEFERPRIDTTPAAGAVDLRRIKPPREEAKKPAEPPKPPPSHPSRIWVQVATGRDKAALGYDWRRMTREAAETFRGKQPYVSAWGQTNRLLTGPFQSEAAANSFIAQLRHADVDGPFVWTSPAGQVVDALSAEKPARR